jgi:anti-sigma regulatory factor (Ser/Thr protein kinase)
MPFRLSAEQDRTFVLIRPAVDVRAPYQARARVAKALADWGLEDLIDDVTLCVSELTTNTLCAKAGEMAVLVEWHQDDHLIEIAVWDNAPGEPEKREPATLATGGRGLNIVAALATEWGLRTGDDDGKVTWARFHTSPGTPRCGPTGSQPPCAGAPAPAK